jgi:hypothetical protein
VGRRLSAWRPGKPDADEALQQAAADLLGVLHRTMRQDPDAFGLYEAACAGGERLAEALASLAESRPPGQDFAARFTVEVGGTGGTIADATVRRAAAMAAQRLVSRHPEAVAAGRGLTDEFLCLLYRWFFADVVVAFPGAVVAEKIKLDLAVLTPFDPEGGIADWIGGQVIRLLPNPCEGRAGTLAGAVEKTQTITDDPAQALPVIAGALVPRAVGRALGLITNAEDGGAAA